ncbi:MAG: hypothetical protein VX278_14855 [Myxococcota bacterium]|nr:hypothetical protein [Myxococcota bacterium]
MRSSEKKPAGTDRQVKTIRGKGKRAGDADSKRLQKIAKQIGNDVLTKHLNQKGSQRDEILAFICSRLKTIHGVQAKEKHELKNERSWYKEVAKGVDGYHLPDPTRWHESARLFQKAGQAICNGHLGKGVQLLEKALEQERATYDSVPKMVKVKLDAHEKQSNNAPASTQKVTANEFCPSVTQPKEMYYADRILNVRANAKPTPPMPYWWLQTGDELEEEEEEEEEEE